MTFYTVLYVHLEKNNRQTSVNEAAECRVLTKDSGRRRRNTERMNPKQLDQTGPGLN